MRIYPLVSLTNNSTVISDTEVDAIRVALQHQISYHFKPYWDSGAVLQFTGKHPIPGSWELAFLDNSDQAGVLGYHDFIAGSLPVGKVFVATDQQYGLSPSVTAGHEMLEMLADAFINLAAQTSDTEFYGYEVGDPVEADSLGYNINIGTVTAPHNILCTDFCLPMWWIPESAGIAGMKCDYKQHLTKPLEVAPDGYCSIFTSGQGWGQYQNKNGQLTKVELEPGNPRFRVRS